MWDDCPDNICFVELIGDKAAVDAAFAKAAHVVKSRFVVNRVTAATMEPRGAVGDYNAADRRYTVYTPMQRPHPVRADLAKLLNVPESKLRIVTGDTGGSFGMKSPIFNETPLVLLASKLTGRPVKWISTRTEAFLSDAQARDNVTEAELALDKDGTFLALRVKTVRRHRRLSAARHAGLHDECRHARRRLPHAGDPRRHHRRVLQHQSDAALSRQRPPGSRLRDRAHGRARRRRARHRPGRIAPAQLRCAVRRCRSRPGSTFTYDCGEFEKNMDLALALADRKGFEKRKAEATQARQAAWASACPTPSSAPARPRLEGAEVRFDRDGSVTMFSGSNSQGQGHETAFKQIVCDRLGLDPERGAIYPGRHRRGVLRRRHRRLALGDAGRLGVSSWRPRRWSSKARAIAAHMLQGRRQPI